VIRRDRGIAHLECELEDSESRLLARGDIGVRDAAARVSPARFHAPFCGRSPVTGLRSRGICYIETIHLLSGGLVGTVDDSLPKLFEQLRTGPSREREVVFRQLYKKLYPRLLHYFLKRVPSQDAQDLTQETLLSIYRSMDSLRDEKGFESWLFKIAQNVYRLYLRRRRADKRSGIEVPIEVAEEQASSPWNPASPLDQTMEQERNQVLHKAIQELPKQMRDCMTLRIGSQLSYREIAVILNLSVETVKAHLHQARRLLRQKLGSDFQSSQEEVP
jgi:RNA polymerase sigma-70 factor (ECF subfamily)